MQQLVILQSLWSMENLRNATGVPTLAENLARIKAADFGGVSAMWENDDFAADVHKRSADLGFAVEGTVLPRSLDELKQHIDRAHRLPIHHLNVQLWMVPDTLAQAEQLLAETVEIANQSDIPVYLETHRGRLTNDLIQLVEMLSKQQGVRLLADLSHYVVAREVELPVDAATLTRIANVLEHAWAFHGRIAGSGQVQLPFSFAQHAPWVHQFETWWTQGFASWRRRAPADAQLTFTCELGPQPYAISGADGRDLTDRWEESLMLRTIAQRAWAVSA
jgi:hypothetical protein